MPDDSVYEEGYTQTGAFAGPDYVEMPKSRVGRIFGRFGKKKKSQDEQSVREWVDVDASYEAQSVGRERGSWESFRSDDDLDAESLTSIMESRIPTIEGGTAVRSRCRACAIMFLVLLKARMWKPTAILWMKTQVQEISVL